MSFFVIPHGNTYIILLGRLIPFVVALYRRLISRYREDFKKNIFLSRLSGVSQVIVSLLGRSTPLCRRNFVTWYSRYRMDFKKKQWNFFPDSREYRK